MALISLYLYFEKCFKQELVFVHLSYIDTLVGTQTHGLKIGPVYVFIVCGVFSYHCFLPKKLQPTTHLCPGSLPRINHICCLTDQDLCHFIGIF